jgi:hypothetical protein
MAAGGCIAIAAAGKRNGGAVLQVDGHNKADKIG